MRTPGADFDLAAGLLLSEGFLGPGQVLRTLTYCLDSALTKSQRYNVVTAELHDQPIRMPGPRLGPISSACGVCGSASLDDVHPPERPPLRVDGGDGVVDSAVLHRLPDALRDSQRVFAATGSAHAAGIFTLAGEAIVVREDVGRHNAVDKVLGARVLGSVSYDERVVLCVSGRIGFDIVSKAVAGALPVVLGVGGPSSLAVALADRAGITVCGFGRGDRFVAYTHPDRIGVSGRG